MDQSIDHIRLQDTHAGWINHKRNNRPNAMLALFQLQYKLLRND